MKIIRPLDRSNPVAGLRRGPDNKIWVAERERNYISCIEEPDSLGYACAFKQRAITFTDSNTICTMGFPIMMPSVADYGLTIPSHDICLGDLVTLPLTGAFVTDSVVWDFGDSASGILNSGYGKKSAHLYNRPGAYWVTATMFVGSEAVSPVHGWVYVHEPPTAIVAAAPPSICSGDTVRLSGLGGVTADWFVGDSLVGKGRNISASPRTSTTFRCIVRSAFGCTDTTEITVKVVPGVVLSVAGSTSICVGDSIELVGQGAEVYVWSASPADPTMQEKGNHMSARPAANTRYRCTGTNSAGCKGTVEHLVNVSAPPVIAASGDTTFCMPVTVTASATGGQTYVWINDRGDTVSRNSTASLTPDRTMFLRVIGTDAFGCKGEDTVRFTRTAPKPFSISGDKVLCEVRPVVLTAQGTDQVVWLDEIGNVLGIGKTMQVQPMETSTYRAALPSSKDCGDTVSHTVHVSTSLTVIAAASPDFVCAGDTVVLRASGAVRFEWRDQSGAIVSSGDSAVVVSNQTTRYRVTGYDSLGCSGEVEVEATVLPFFGFSIVTEPVTFDIDDGLQHIPVLLRSPNDFVGRTIGPVAATITFRRASLHVQWFDPDVVSMAAETPNSATFEVIIDTVHIVSASQALTVFDVRPLLDRDSVTIVEVRLRQLEGVANCRLDSLSDEPITITGCGRNMHGGIVYVEAPDVHVWPNPVSGDAQVRVRSGLPGRHNVEILDALGRTVYVATYANDLRGVLDISSLIPAELFVAGVHEARLVTESAIVSKVFVVLR